MKDVADYFIKALGRVPHVVADGRKSEGGESTDVVICVLGLGWVGTVRGLRAVAKEVGRDAGGEIRGKEPRGLTGHDGSSGRGSRGRWGRWGWWVRASCRGCTGGSGGRG